MKKTKGISLIVLVITIIVMIIIAGAIIISLTETNVIDQAEVAADKYNLSQLKEAVNLDRTNTLLTRYNTTEGVNISVKELFGLTDSDAMEITSTNTMPANMPAGKYYKLDVTKYGMQSAGTVENNTIKGAYVINDNYDIYYVVEGTTSEVAQEIDDEKVIQLILSLLGGNENEANIVDEIKKELHIEHIEGENGNDIMRSFRDEKYENFVCNFYHINRIYILDQNMQGKYVSKAENPTTYEYAEKVNQIVSELSVAFLGKTESEVQGKYNDGTLNSYILDNCSSIKTVNATYDGTPAYMKIREMTFEFGEPEYDDYDFCDYNTFTFISDENGVYTKVYLEAGA